jgi:hypothetical protein
MPIYHAAVPGVLHGDTLRGIIHFKRTTGFCRRQFFFLYSKGWVCRYAAETVSFRGKEATSIAISVCGARLCSMVRHEERFVQKILSYEAGNAEIFWPCRYRARTSLVLGRQKNEACTIVFRISFPRVEKLCRFVGEEEKKNGDNTSVRLFS